VDQSLQGYLVRERAPRTAFRTPSGIVGGAGRFGSVEPLQAIGHSDGLGGGADGSLKPAAAALSGGGRTHAARGPTAASIPTSPSSSSHA
jgi:hypothetical protein